MASSVILQRGREIKYLLQPSKLLQVKMESFFPLSAQCPGRNFFTDLRPPLIQDGKVSPFSAAERRKKSSKIAFSVKWSEIQFTRQ